MIEKTVIAPQKGFHVGAFLTKHRSIIALIILVAIVSVLNPYFFTLDNIFNVLKQSSVNALIAVGMTFVILTAGIDLSVGSVLALSGAIAATLVANGFSVYVVVPITLIGGLILGSISGVIVAFGKVQPFIATLVTMTLLRGVTMVFSDGKPISLGFNENADAFVFLGMGDAFGVPVPVIVMIIVFALAWYVLRHTKVGRYIYALGGNEAATQLSGIPVNRIKVFVYAVCGLLSALAAILSIARLNSAQASAGVGFELDAIAAVVVGGASLTGGKGRIMGTLIGVLIIGILGNAMNLLNVNAYYQLIVKALVILLAVLADNFLSSKKV